MSKVYTVDTCPVFDGKLNLREAIDTLERYSRLMNNPNQDTFSISLRLEGICTLSKLIDRYLRAYTIIAEK